MDGRVPSRCRGAAPAAPARAMSLGQVSASAAPAPLSLHEPGSVPIPATPQPCHPWPRGSHPLLLHEVDEGGALDLHGLALPVVHGQDEVEEVGFAQVGRRLLLKVGAGQAHPAAAGRGVRGVAARTPRSPSPGPPHLWDRLGGSCRTPPQQVTMVPEPPGWGVTQGGTRQQHPRGHPAALEQCHLPPALPAPTAGTGDRRGHL